MRAGDLTAAFNVKDTAVPGFDLDPLFAPLSSLPGVGAKTAERLRRLLRLDRDPRVLDLLFHLPERAIERCDRPSLFKAVDGEIVTVFVRVIEHYPPSPGSREPYKIVASDGAVKIDLIHWGEWHKEFARLLPRGAHRRVSGVVKAHHGALRMYPDYVEDAQGPTKIPKVEPIYPLTKGISQLNMRKLIGMALRELPDLPEWHDAELLRRHGWPSVKDALRRLHGPGKVGDVAADGPARSRLAYDECLTRQLSLAIRSAKAKQKKKRPTIGDGRLRESILFDFPHSLTTSQERAVSEIIADLAKPHVTTRLVQGDVGSGKTMVALLAAATVAEGGRQAALMAPTEILARQHLDTIAPLAQAAGMSVALLTSKTPRAERGQILARLASGEIGLLIGTHALTGADVIFKDMALAIVDEQHIFGVDQRLALVKKGEAVDGLLLSATPIPRTMVLATFGDMAVSELREKPAGRLPVKTSCHKLEGLDDVIEAVGRALAADGRVFWVCPRVEISEKSDLAAATERFSALRSKFGPLVDLVHGKMKAADKEAAMARFAGGETRLLVASTVIEVGIDVPEATVMVVEHADQFGLATLHQLRGRVGRGRAQAFCLLLHDAGDDGDTARARLAIMRETDDGFRIADEDLRLRGAGDLLGKRQSGVLDFRIADVAAHAGLLKAAAEDARQIVAADPDLPGSQGRALGMLRNVFGRSYTSRPQPQAIDLTSL